MWVDQVKSISLNDVDGDSQVEIITSGITCAEGSFVSTSTVPEQAQLRVWSLERRALGLSKARTGGLTRVRVRGVSVRARLTVMELKR